MYRNAARNSPRFQTGKFSRVQWTHRGASVDSLFTFVAIDTRSAKASAKSTFVEDNYFPEITKHVDYWTPKSGGKNQNCSPQGPKQIYKAFERMKLVCQRDRGHPFNPSRIFTYKKNVIKYNRETEYLPELDSFVDNNNSSLYENGQIEKISHEPVVPLNENEPFYDKIREIHEYYRRCKMATNTPDCADDQSTITSADKKYWSQRYKFFEKFNKGILLERESFYSVCPEPLAYHIAKRCQNVVAIDPFCGAGGNVIQLAMTCRKVIAMDIDAEKVRMAKMNAKIYGVDHKIEFYVGDFFKLSGAEFRADVLVTSPPWGGPGYSAMDTYSLRSMCQANGGGIRILEIAKRIAPNVAIHLPKTTNVRELISLAKDWGKIEIQQNVINEKLNSITAFYGEFKSIAKCSWPPYL